MHQTVISGKEVRRDAVGRVLIVMDKQRWVERKCRPVRWGPSCSCIIHGDWTGGKRSGGTTAWNVKWETAELKSAKTFNE